MKNERTSKRVAAIAGRVLRMLAAYPASQVVTFWAQGEAFRVGDLRALAASCLTQAPSKTRAKKRVKRA